MAGTDRCGGGQKGAGHDGRGGGWKTTPGNAQHTRIIGRYDNAKPALIVARQDLDEEVGKKLLAALVAWMPKWQAVFGAFRPYYYADVQAYFHDLNGLPADI